MGAVWWAHGGWDELCASAQRLAAAAAPCQQVVSDRAAPWCGSHLMMRAISTIFWMVSDNQARPRRVADGGSARRRRPAGYRDVECPCRGEDIKAIVALRAGELRGNAAPNLMLLQEAYRTGMDVPPVLTQVLHCPDVIERPPAVIQRHRDITAPAAHLLPTMPNDGARGDAPDRGHSVARCRSAICHQLPFGVSISGAAVRSRTAPRARQLRLASVQIDTALALAAARLRRTSGKQKRYSKLY